MKIRKTLIVFLVAVLIALPLKIYQLLTTVDYSTGFLKAEGAVSIILPIVLVLSVIGAYLAALLSKDFPRYSPNEKSVPMGIISAITALAIGWDSAADLLDQENAMFEGTIGLVYSCLGLICVLAFLFPAVSFFMGNNLIESRPVIMMLPVLWMSMRMVMTFLAFTTRANINESIYDLVFMIFMMLFLLAAAKFLSGAAENSSKMLFGSGMAAALFGLLASIPRYILSLSGKTEFAQLADKVKVPYRANFSDLMLAVFAIGLMFYISIPVKQRMPQRVPVPAAARPNGAPQQYQRQPGQPARAPYAQGMPGQMMRPPYMQQPRRPIMQRPLPGAGPDAYTNRGAGMRVADDFSSVGQMSETTMKYGGIDTFRDDMLSGRRALEVLESSMTIDHTDDEEGLIMTPTFTVGDIAELTEMEESADELEELNEEVTASLSSLFAQRENSVLAPKQAVIAAASDEAADVIEAVQEPVEPEFQPPARRSVSLGSGRRGGRLADRLNEMDDRRRERERPPQRTPVGRMPYGDYDERYDDYEEEAYYDDRGRYGGYEPYDDGYDDGGSRGYYDDEYYDEVEYGASDYDEYDDDEYDDDYDEYDDEYYDEDEYDDDEYEYDDDYDEYDDEGYGAPKGGYNYW